MLSYKSITVLTLAVTTVIIATIITSCQKNVLNKSPLDIIPENIVWSDSNLINAYLTGAYVNTTVMTNDAIDVARSSTPFFTIFYVNNVSDESKSTSNFSGNMYQYKTSGLKIGGGLMEWWERPYNIIRSLNEMIERLPSVTLGDNFKNQRIAEARFLRAFNYFYMVKRYGGVPLITKLQSITDPKDTLYPKRNSEKELYDFVISEALDISNILPETQADADWGRPTKYTALALASRAALYAGSIARYGKIQLNGLLGIDASLAANYFKISYDASQKIIQSHKFSLYNGNPDKITNFKNIFLTKRNSEVIFAVQHDGSDKDYAGAGWCYDYFQCPYPNGWANGIHDAPYLEMVQAFENTDGSSSILDQSVLDTKLWTMTELWGKKDPRFFATIYTQETKWQGRSLNFYNGLITSNGTLITSGSYQGILANGDQKSTQTGFGVLKYLDETKDNGNSSTAGIFGSKQDYIVFRYAEILLNDAEAAYELGNSPQSLSDILLIRDRAGVLPLTTIDLNTIRHERQVELAFEGHRYWDVRRWRIATTVLSQNGHGLRYILDYATGKYKLIIKDKMDGAVTPPIFTEANYYFPITNTRTSNNANLVENPNY